MNECFSDSESDVDLLVPIKSLLNERAEVYKAKGLDGFPAVGIKVSINAIIEFFFHVCFTKK